MFSLNNKQMKYISYTIIIIILIIILINTFLTKLNNDYNNKIFENTSYDVTYNENLIEGLTNNKDDNSKQKNNLWNFGIQFNSSMCAADASINEINNNLELFTNGNALSVFNDIYNKMNNYNSLDKYLNSSDYKTFKKNIEFLKELNVLHESINKFDVDCGNINNKASMSSKTSSFFSNF